MTIKREEAVHFCPEPPKAPTTAASIATCKSASSAITRAFLLPISSWQRTKLGIAIVANEYVHAEKVMQKVFETMDSFPELERTLTNTERL